MNIKHLHVGIIHSLIGKNDGVSIVIDQTVQAMVKDMHIDLGDIYFLSAHCSPRFNSETDDVFWHKNDTHNLILRTFNGQPPAGLDVLIHEKATYAKELIKDFVDRHKIDLLIAHNTSHPLNLITAVGLGYYLEELRGKNIIWPNVLVWWHDSYFERERFSKPNAVIRKYLKYLPGTDIDGVVFINNSQPALAKKVFRKYNKTLLESFFRERAVVIPNTCEIPWDWQHHNWQEDRLIYPKQDNYNDHFFKDIGLLAQLDDRGFTPDHNVLLLQHTRIVPRKRIEVAIDYAFGIEQKYRDNGLVKCVTLLVSGYSGDEQNEYKKFLQDYYEQKTAKKPAANVLLIFGEDSILSHRDIIVDKKYYQFDEIPSIVAAHGGMGTYFSDVEGFGNNLLEMASFGLPVAINQYEIYKLDIAHLGFRFPSVEDCKITADAVDEGYRLLTDIRYRNEVCNHNLQIMQKNLGHNIIAEKLKPLIIKMFTELLT